MGFWAEETIFQIIDDRINEASKHNNLAKERSGEELRLVALELAVKANAGYGNSFTEEAFLKSMKLLKKDRTLNSFGRAFVCHMTYNHSNKRPRCFETMEKHRR